MSQYLIGIDVGTSSIKASIVDASTGQTVSSAHSPAEEMTVSAWQPGWAEQHPDVWWEHTTKSIQSAFRKTAINSEEVVAIGISYQMHGLVLVDKEHKPLRPAIIWCDSRAVELGNKAFADLGNDYCLQHLLNSPGNFTASKLKWVQEKEPGIYERIYKVMLPGDFIALKLTGDITTTETGLSEGMFWDYKEKAISKELFDYYGIDKSLIATIVPVFATQGKLRESVAKELGLKPGIKISYRAGDQPNNAFSLNVLNPGETAATAGTSGVIYSVTDKNAFDLHSRVNAFIHVNSSASIRNGVLLCINGTGILNSWLKKNIRSSGSDYDYEQINTIADEAPIGADGLIVLPFGNGAERILKNKDIKSSFIGLNFNRHNQSHLFRAAQEGIVFALKYGFDILKEMGLKTNVIRAGNANMFLSPLFREAFVNTIGARLELYDTDGAKGAALGAGVGAGVFHSYPEAFRGLKMMRYEEPDKIKAQQYETTYQNWKTQLNKLL